MHCVIGILAALMQRHATGEGQQVEVSMQDAVVNLIRVCIRDHQRFGKPKARTGNQLGGGVPGKTYRCHPGGPNDYVFIYAQQQMWHPLLRAMGRADLVGDPRYETAEARWQRKDEIDALVEAWTSERSKHEVMKILAGAGVPCGACLDTGEVHDRPAPPRARHDRRGRAPRARAATSPWAIRSSSPPRRRRSGRRRCSASTARRS